VRPVELSYWLSRVLTLTGEFSNISIGTLDQASSVISQFGNAHLHWRLAGAAVQSAQLDPLLLDHATAALERALKLDGLIA
jgi:hypothetical protein